MKKINESKVKMFWDKRASMSNYNFIESITEFNDTNEMVKRNKIELNELKNISLPTDSMALDLGCGTGRYSSILSKKCKQVLSVDYSKSILDLARKVNSFDNVKYIQCNVEDFLIDTKFDIVIVAGLFIYLNDSTVDSVIRNASKMLKKDGIVFLRSSVGVEKRFEIVDKYSEELKTKYNAIYRTPNEHHDMFMKYGLVPTKEKLLYQHRKETAQMQFTYKKERTIGILGGMGPYATLDLYQKILNINMTEKDWQHPRILIDSNTKIPSRTRAIIYNEKSPENAMLESINNLGKCGADFVVIACNSAHYFLPKIKPDIPVISIIDIALSTVLENMPKIKKVGLLAATVTMSKKLYYKVFSEKGIEIITIPSEQDTIMSLVEKVKTNTHTNKDKEVLDNVIKELIKRGSESIVLGCTELPLLFSNQFSIPVYDINNMVAKYVVKYAKYKV